METKKLLTQLEECAKNIGIEIRYDKGKFESGFCKVGERNILVLHKNKAEEEYIRIIGEELVKHDLEKIYLMPVVRNYLDSL
ncbi:MAG: hypothetical protein HQK84_05695 [Nitrospinae bacterium]|nr:hypothetical protein [Nitrospinota bacterium]